MALSFPPIYLFHSFFEHDPQELHQLEKEIGVVWDIKEAELVLGKINSKRRAKHELAKLGLKTVGVHGEDNSGANSKAPKRALYSPNKRRKLDSTVIDGKEVIALDSDTESGADAGNTPPESSKRRRGTVSPSGPMLSSKADPRMPNQRISTETPKEAQPESRTIKVLKLVWYHDSIKAGRLLPFKNYLVYEGRIGSGQAPGVPTSPKITKLPPNQGKAILAGAKADSPPPPSQRSFHRHKAPGSGSKGSRPSSQLVQLHHETTSEHEGASYLPPLPEYLNTIYSCQRPTPLHCPNEEFLSQLRIIKKGRLLLENDDVAVRAYSAAVAAIAAYPYTLTSPKEITRLPNAGKKIAQIWKDWNETGHIEEVDELEADPKFQSVSIFYDIHDVGAVNGRKFYDYGWRDLDDVVEHGWDKLSRDQQIGVKYYYELQERIPREEVESIAQVILNHANAIRTGYQMVICGGYRRGKPTCGDVDIVISHPDGNATKGFVVDLCQALEDSEYLTHRLKTSTKNSERDQETLAWKGSMTKSGSGFDTLDHAFIVWRDPNWSSMNEYLKKDPNAKNPNVHRRVDIIITPWKTAGCAVVGWTGGTMFQRDLRLYCRQEKKLKFDSSGVRTLKDGAWVDLEVGEGDLLVKEKRIFEGLGLAWREPTERCTD